MPETPTSAAPRFPMARRRWRNAALWTVLAAATLLTSGCAGWVRDNLTQTPTPWRRIQPAALPVTLPDSRDFSIVAARMRDTGAVYKTYIVALANPTILPGENRLTIDVHTLPDSLFGALVQPPRVFPVPLYTMETLTETTRHEFPDMRVKVADAARRNRYGDYDYVVAQDEANSCVLAWQLITDHKRMLPERIEAVRLEYRVCGVGSNIRALLAPFDGLSLTLPETVLEAQDLGGL
ncbi:cellulose biosynthesis protein BcsN [Azospirillum sp. B510]|uniref:cellulose biosynthesis protein BcsN n=1 Tax=Azospirillum sp. (strain B510) TaxID=137722 RepID=UPI001FFF6957|nr:cellulose biosynthesis protein BcsN [Azospirillum sp. B510]